MSTSDICIMLDIASCIPYDFVRQADPGDVKLINEVLELVDFGEVQGESLQALPPPAPLPLPSAPVVQCSADLSSQIVPHDSRPSPPTTAEPPTRHIA